MKISTTRKGCDKIPAPSGRFLTQKFDVTDRVRVQVARKSSLAQDPCSHRQGRRHWQQRRFRSDRGQKCSLLLTSATPSKTFPYQIRNNDCHVCALPGVRVQLSVMKKGRNKKRRLSSIFLTQRFDLTARCARAVCSATIVAHVPAGRDSLQSLSTPASLSLQGSTEPLGPPVRLAGFFLSELLDELQTHRDDD